MTADNDVVLLEPADPAAPPAPAEPDPDRLRGRRMFSFYTRLRWAGPVGGTSRRVFRAFVADDVLLLVDLKVTELYREAAAAHAAKFGETVGGFGAAAAHAARVGRIEAAVDKADEWAVRNYVAKDSSSHYLPAAAFAEVTVGKPSVWARVRSGQRAGVAEARLARPSHGVAGLTVLALQDLNPVIGAMVALSGDTARVDIDPRFL